MKPLFIFASVLFLFLISHGEEAIRPAEQALQGKDFEKAAELLQEYLGAEDAEGLDYATYLLALSYLHAEKNDEAIAACDTLLKDYQDSVWFRKARFVKASALVKQKKFEGAEKIYEEEAIRLFSSARKAEVASVLIKFGDELSREPEPGELDAPPADFNKALQLYNKALTLEIGREVRDDVQFKVAGCFQKLQNWGEAEKHYQAYLKEFDPSWSGPVGSPERLRNQRRENPLPAGEHWKEARFNLVEVQLSMCGQSVTITPGMRHEALTILEDSAASFLPKLQSARQNAEDLLTLLDEEADKRDALISDTHWLRVRSFNLPFPARNELDQALQAGREFIAAHPKHPRATDTSRYLAMALQHVGRIDDAIAAYEDFAEGKNFTFVPEDGEIDPEIKTGKSCSETFANWTKEAFFKIGQLRFQQKKYEEAVQQWEQYIAKYPNGEHWSQCQSGIINAEFQIGIDAVAAKNYDVAKKHFDDFLKSYPLDSRARQILFTLGQIKFSAAEELEDSQENPDDEQAAAVREAYQLAVEEWNRLVSKYPNTEESSLALYRIGVIQEEKLGELEQALATYQRLTWGTYSGQARQRYDTMTRHHLEVKTERSFRSNEEPFIEVTSRNAPKLQLSQYFLNLEAYFRKTHGTGEIHLLDVDLIQPDKTWEVEVADYAKYKPSLHRIPIPFAEGEPGVCIIKVAEEDFEATTLVIRSDIDIITKSSRRELLVFAQNRLTNEPAPGVSVLASDGEKVFGIGETGEDGVFRENFHENLKEGANVRVFAQSKDGFAANFLDLQRLGFSSGLSPRGYIYTDKPAYRPGETIHIRSILRDVDDGSYIVPKDKSYFVRVYDPKSRLLQESVLTPSDFGALDSEIEIHSDAPLGNYTISVTEKDQKSPKTFNGSFQVQRYKLEKVKLAFEFPREVYFRGEKITTKLKAEYYWGSPAAAQEIDYTFPDGRTYSGRTDEEGIIELEYDPSGFLPGRGLSFSAIAKAHNVSAQKSVFLAQLGFGITVASKQEVALSGEPFDVEVKTVAADGTPVGKDLTLYVLRREVPETSKVLSAVPWINRPSLASAEVTVEEHMITTDPETGTGVQKLQLKEGGSYVLRASGEDRFEQVVTGQSSMTVSDDEDSVKLRFFADSSTGQVGAKLPLRLHSRIDEGLALLTYEGEEIISHRILTLKPGFNAMDVDLDHPHFPNFRVGVVALDGREIRSAHKDIKVERLLNISLKPRQEIYAPGAEAFIEVEVTDQNGEPVQAALSVALVNEALFSLYPDPVSPIRQFFESSAQRRAEFRLGSSAGFNYAGMTRKVVKSVAEEKERLERDQKELQQLAQMQQGLGYGYGGAQMGQASAPSSTEAPLVQSINAPMEEAEVSREFVQSRVQFNEEMGEALDDQAKNIVHLGDKEMGGEGQAKPREEKMESGRWVSPVVTDAKGKAVVAIPLPESTTKWTLLSRGCSKETLVGQATASLVTRKDFFLDLKTPNLLQEGDQMSFLSQVHNLTDFEGKVPVTLEIGDFKDTKTVLIKKQSVTDVVFKNWKVPAVESITITARATAGDLSDSVAKALPIRPWGMEFSSSAGGITNGSASAVLKLPPKQEYTWKRLDVTLSPSIMSALLDFALSEHSHSTLENQLLAVVSALEYGRANAVQAEDLRRLRERADSLVAALTSTQEEDGIWSCKGRPHLLHSSRVYWALSRASQSGIKVHAETLRKAETRIKEGFAGLATNDNDSKAVLIHAFSITKRADFAHMNRIYRERANLSPTALAYMAAAFANMDRPEFARDLVDLLDQKAESKEIEGRPTTTTWPGGSRSWLQDSTETTAVALLAYAAVKVDSPLAEQAANALLANRGCFRFSSPKAFGPSVAALAAFYESREEAETDFEIEVLVNNEAIKTISSAEVEGVVTLEIPSNLIGDDDTIVRFEMKGRGNYHYAATLTGFSPDFKNPESWGSGLRFTGGGYYHSNFTYRGVPLESTSTSPVTKVEIGQRIRATSSTYNSSSERGDQRVRIEYLPAGMLLVEDSVTGNYDRIEYGDSEIRFFYGEGQPVQSLEYELVAYAPGTYRVLPGVIKDFYNTHRMTIGSVRDIKVLKPGQKSDDPYQMNRYERFELSNLNFNDGNYEVALEYLTHLFEHDRKHYEKDIARMLLWIYTMEEHFDAEQVVQMFEILRERHPSLSIPFDKILAVGKAYRIIGEHERAWLVFRATIDSSFINDASISATLEDQGQFLSSLDYQKEIWEEYPDTPFVVNAHFAIAQQLYKKAPNAHELIDEERRRQRMAGKKEDLPDRIALLKRTVDSLHQFLTLYPNDPLADDGAFSMANTFFALKDYQTVVNVAELFRERYPDSEFESSFQYMEALGHFWQLAFDDALKSAAAVADGESKDRDYARYITAQIHHAQGQPAEAIEWYEKVQSLYPDAKEAIDYFEEQKIALEEVTTFKPGEEVEVEVKYRNIKEAYLQIYKVDLMKLYLREKNLSNITEVHLAGIEPESELTIPLGNGKDYRDLVKKAKLPLKEEGAYLVICRGDNLFTSGMVLVTPLKLEIQESPGAGSLRVNVRDTVKDGYLANVHVKAIGESDSEFQAGDTDLRGVFVAEGLNGIATVIARKDTAHYAFYRGSLHLGQSSPEQAAPVSPDQRDQPQPQLKKGDYLRNLDEGQMRLNGANINQWDAYRRGGGGKGVEVQKAY